MPRVTVGESHYKKIMNEAIRLGLDHQATLEHMINIYFQFSTLNCKVESRNSPLKSK